MKLPFETPVKNWTELEADRDEMRRQRDLLMESLKEVCIRLEIDGDIPGRILNEAKKLIQEIEGG